MEANSGAKSREADEIIEVVKQLGLDGRNRTETEQNAIIEALLLFSKESGLKDSEIVSRLCAVYLTGAFMAPDRMFRYLQERIPLDLRKMFLNASIREAKTRKYDLSFKLRTLILGDDELVDSRVRQAASV